MLDYRIETFLTLYEQMNYRRTAEMRNMTQPGVTQHIHCLEKYYGVKLFEYNGRQLRRTKEADRLRQHFESVLAQERSLKADFSRKDRLHLKVGATKTIGEFVMVPQITAFLAQEDCGLDLMVDNTQTLLAMVCRGELDFAVIEGVFDKAQYPHHLFKKERFVGICGKHHRFAGKTVALEEILEETLILREKGSGTRMLLQQAVEDKGYTLDSFRRCTAVSNFSVICELVARNGAITFAYEPIARCREDLTTFQVEDVRIRGEFNFVYASREAALPRIRRFLGAGDPDFR